ncbi:hypothetical protein FOA52_000711 [Chlamydomonas sp. UWO 241]|nr:hypothetical protein FOA52_000711 [Chlamydomonas sp. UWO 241]
MVGPAVSQSTVNAIDWTIAGVAGALFSLSALGALYAACHGWRKKGPAAGDFNFLWRARVLSQLLAGLLATCQLLPLQVLWGPRGVVPGGFYTVLLCRLFTAVTFGVAEPGFLLVALLACLFSVTRQVRPPVAHPNTSIVLSAFAFTVPMAVAQVVCALFTFIFDINYSPWILATLFETFEAGLVVESACPMETLPGGVPQPAPNCAFCTFALLSTIVSSFFGAVFLGVGAYVTQRAAAAAISKRLVRRVRWLQALVLLLLPLSLTCRGLTVLFDAPYDLGFQVLRLGYVVCTVALVAFLSCVLVVRPVADARAADAAVRAHLSRASSTDTPASAMWLLGRDEAKPSGGLRDGAAAPGGGGRRGTAAIYIVDGVTQEEEEAARGGGGRGALGVDEDLEAAVPMLAAAAAAAAGAGAAAKDSAARLLDADEEQGGQGGCGGGGGGRGGGGSDGGEVGEESVLLLMDGYERPTTTTAMSTADLPAGREADSSPPPLLHGGTGQCRVSSASVSPLKQQQQQPAAGVSTPWGTAAQQAAAQQAQLSTEHSSPGAGDARDGSPGGSGTGGGGGGLNSDRTAGGADAMSVGSFTVASVASGSFTPVASSAGSGAAAQAQHAAAHDSPVWRLDSSGGRGEGGGGGGPAPRGQQARLPTTDAPL